MDWYGEIMDDDARWGGSPPEPRRIIPKAPHPQSRERGAWMGAFMDCLAEGREYQLTKLRG